MASLTDEVKDALVGSLLHQALINLEEKPVIEDNGPNHGIHIACQVDQPFYIATCGALLDPSEKLDDFDPTRGNLCIECWSDPAFCPVCKIELVSLIRRTT